MSAKFKHNINVLISNMYNGQVASSKKRGHERPEYTKEEFTLWVIKQLNFSVIYLDWVNSNYDTKLIPSVDRFNNDMGYSFNNIRLVTFLDNMKRGHEGRHKSVKQLALDGSFIAEYKNITEASKALDISIGCISRVCLNQRNKTGGFKWEFS